MTDKPQFVGKKVTIGELGKTQSGGTPSSKHPEFLTVLFLGSGLRHLMENSLAKMTQSSSSQRKRLPRVPQKLSPKNQLWWESESE